MSKIDSKACKTIVVLAIEHTLLKTSKATLEKVQSGLHQEFNCDISDCYEHPERLNRVLKDLFGATQYEIVKEVNRYLDEFSYQGPVAEFLGKIRQS
ncbi:MAG: hypothetical protein ACREA5_00470 [Nitrosotalea sp.]